VRVTIHNVGHGLCVSLVHENGNVMLWDCGHAVWKSPSEFLPAQRIDHIDHFFVTNYDEDHISDLPNLRAKLDISILHRNTSISADQLQQLKLQSGPISPSMESMLDMIRICGGPPTIAPAFPRVRCSEFWNNYGTEFDNTNNISLVTFLECGILRLIIPEDLEVAGWKALLENDKFQRKLADVNVFIASHHGRESGYCADVFDICKPNVVVFSDSAIKNATQEMASTYESHTSGVIFNGQTRYVLSTRNDGPIRWDV